MAPGSSNLKPLKSFQLNYSKDLLFESQNGGEMLRNLVDLKLQRRSFCFKALELVAR